MNRSTIVLDEKALAIVEAKKAEMYALTGGGSTSGAIRAILIEWDRIKVAGQTKTTKQAAK